MNENRYSILWHALEKIEQGGLEITLPNGNKMRFEANNCDEIADMKILDWKVLDSILTGGDIALGETYMLDLWRTSNLPLLINFLASNSRILENFFHANKMKLVLFAVRNLFRRNSKIGSRKNIRYHYDLGNDFYNLWLDESMTYSSALFDGNGLDLKAAQENKYNRIISKINHGDVLEIGCGWGGFMDKAAEKCRKISGLTLSNEQAKYSVKRFDNKGISAKTEVKLQDYRDENNLYDSIVSIEMFEAVGKEFWDKYFSCLRRCLKKGGNAVIQTITIDDDVYDKYQNRFDFIQKHIFPGGFLPSKKTFKALASKHDLVVKDEFAFGNDYQKTLLAWFENFNKQKDKIKMIGFDDQFIRKWSFYLAYCAAGFASQRTDVVQFELS